MSGTPQIKVFDSNGRYQAACKEICAAACLMSLYGDGSTIRFGHSKSDIVWIEGKETQPAYESYDYVQEISDARWLQRNIKAMKKAGYSDDQITEILAAA